MWAKKLKSTVKFDELLGEPFPELTDRDLDAFEKKHRFRLPTSYRQFVKEFGPGELGEYFRICAPQCGRQISHADLANEIYSFEKGRDFLATVLPDPELVRRLVPFSNTIGGDVIGWDPADLTDQDSNEYAIIAVPRDQEKLFPLASTFREYVEKVCLGAVFAKKLGLKNWSVRKTFVPYGQ